MLSFTEVNEILRTLPTGYYLKDRIEHRLDAQSTATYYDPMKFEIVISYPMIANIKNISAEEDIRCLLYHEISHAMLTPKNLYSAADDLSDAVYYSQTKLALEKNKQLVDDIKNGKFDTQGKTIKDVYDLLCDKFKPLYSSNQIRDLINIFEDQRIETLNKNVFLKVDFQSFTKKLNNYSPNDKPKDFQSFFYHVVRFNDMEPEIVKIVYNAIYKLSNINSTTNDWYKLRPYAGLLFDIIYACAMKWDQIQSQQAQSQQSKQAGQGQGQQGQQSSSGENTSEQDNPNGEAAGSNESASADGENPSDNPAGNESTGGENDPNGTPSHGAGSGLFNPVDEQTRAQIEEEAMKNNGFVDKEDKTAQESLAETLRRSIGKVIHRYDCLPEFNQRAEAIILRMLKKKSIESKALAGYSGRLNPKNIHRPGRVENYRWFDKPNPNGLNNSFGKFRINFFCDNSGSFDNNKQKANSIIRCLWQLSKKYKSFEFTLVTHDDEHIVRDDSNMGIECNGGTEVTDKIYGIYNSLQKVGQTVWNIVLFDGGVNSKESEKNYRVWNHQNVIMICDTCDQVIIEKKCPKAKKIFTSNYLAELEANLISCMDQLFR